jgi:hypothetical protein
VTATAAEVRQRDSLQLRIYRAVNDAADVMDSARTMRARIRGQLSSASGAAADSLRAFDARLAQFDQSGGGRGGRGGRGGNVAASVPAIQSQLMSFYGVIDDADALPTTQVRAASAARLREMDTLLAQFRAIPGR